MTTEMLLVGLGEAAFGAALAALTRLVHREGLEGQTYWLVVAGVAGTVLIATPLLGWRVVAVLAVCFGITGLPMGVEYFGRVLSEVRAAREAQMALLEGEDDETV